MSRETDSPPPRYESDAQVEYGAQPRPHDEGVALYAPGVELPTPGGELLTPPSETGAAVPHPDDPPWGIFAAVGVLVASFVLMFLLQILLIIPYAISLGVAGQGDIARVLQGDKNVILLSILAILPAHLLTLLLCWWVVTGGRKRPFWRTLGWHWSPRLGATELWLWAGLALALLGVSITTSQIFGEQETELERWLKSSNAARYAIAALATLTAPVVEEVVYRGVLYSALRRRLGAALSVGAVLAVFAAIHFPQYKESWAALTTIVVLSGVLTVVRARTGRLLPCVVIHFIFNGITSAVILLAPYLEPPAPTPAPPTPDPAAALLTELLASVLSLVA